MSTSDNPPAGGAAAGAALAAGVAAGAAEEAAEEAADSRAMMRAGAAATRGVRAQRPVTMDRMLGMLMVRVEIIGRGLGFWV